MRLVLLALSALGARAAPTWSPLSPDAPARGPAPRLGAAALPLGGGGAIAVTGGCSSSCCFAPLADVWAFAGGAWANLTSESGAAPTGRFYHGASPAPAAPGDGAGASAFFVFGGDDVTNGVLAELWRLVLAPGALARWSLLAPPPPLPPARSGHSQSALAGGGFAIYGGETDDATLDDAWVFASEARGWARVAAAGGPGARAQHAALALALPRGGGGGGAPARALIVVGGADGDDNDHADVWLLALDAPAPAWARLDAGGGPSPRRGHALWGGVAPAAAGAPVALRGGVAPAAAGAPVALRLFIYGGQNSSVADPGNFHADLWRFDAAVAVGADGSVAPAGSGAFTLVDGGGHAGTPGPRALAAVDGGAGGGVLATGFSGFNGDLDDRLHNDVWALNASA
jgi:hypothetical protein